MMYILVITLFLRKVHRHIQLFKINKNLLLFVLKNIPYILNFAFNSRQIYNNIKGYLVEYVVRSIRTKNDLEA